MCFLARDAGTGQVKHAKLCFVLSIHTVRPLVTPAALAPAVRSIA
jgi:hypothetical protein